MVNSHGPRNDNTNNIRNNIGNNLATSNVKQLSEIGSEVEIIHHGQQMFKKKNKINKI